MPQVDRVGSYRRPPKSASKTPKKKPADDEEETSRQEEVDSLRQMLRHLSEEQESYDHRRSFAMKSQIFQLERQCALMQSSLQKRATSVDDAQLEIHRLADYFRRLLEDSEGKPAVVVPRAEIQKKMRSLEKVGNSLRKQRDLSHGGSALDMPLLPVNKFAMSEVTCLDVLSSKQPINLQNVGRLEEELNKLRVKIVRLEAALKCCDVSEGENLPPEKYLMSENFKRIRSLGSDCCEQIEDCCQDLLTLSMLHPNAPWKVTRDPEKFGAFDPDKIVAGVFKGPGQVGKAKDAIKRMCLAHAYLMRVGRDELSGLREELWEQKSINRNHVHYANSLLVTLEQAHEKNAAKFEEIVEPLREVRDAWLAVKHRQSEATMRNFLDAFATNERHFEDFLPEDGDESEALRRFTEHLQTSLRRAQAESAERRALNSREMQNLRDGSESALVDAIRLLTF